MDQAVVVALIAGGAVVIGQLVNSLINLYGIRLTAKSLNASLANAKTLAIVKDNTNGLLAKIGSDALAKGIEEGHATGVASGVEAGIKSEQDRAK